MNKFMQLAINEAKSESIDYSQVEHDLCVELSKTYMNMMHTMY